MTRNTTQEHARMVRHVADALEDLGRPNNATSLRAAADELDRLDEQINSPHTAEFLEAVKLEAIHQRERWGSEHDAGKSDADWFWLVGYLTGKALNSGIRAAEESASDSVPDNDEAARPHLEKRVHHIITTAAALLNWHRARTTTDNRMRPGIAPPEPVEKDEDGDCRRCGLPWPDERETTEPHECPQGFREVAP